MHQKVGNACGTIALMHSLLNAPIPSLGNGTLSRFHHETRDKTPAERAIALENFEGIFILYVAWLAIHLYLQVFEKHMKISLQWVKQ